MAHSKPFLHVYRPFIAKQSTSDLYLLDDDYYPSHRNDVAAFSLLEDNLLSTFRYIEPADGNLATFSHELYQLLLRACTEFESLASKILERNGYVSQRSNWNILDYYKIDQAYRLSEYEASLPFWRGNQSTLTPFANWKTGHSLSWYQDYNSIKHDRASLFEHANLSNTLNAIAGVFITLHAQLHHCAFGRHRPDYAYHTDGPWIAPLHGLFSLKPPVWPDGEKYDFDWSVLSSDPKRFQKFTFQ